MRVLFKKDLFISIKSILLYLCFSLLLGMMGYMVNEDFMAQNIYISIVLMSTLGILTGIIVEDYKYNTDMLFNSLSLERKTIVISKYLSMGLLPLLFGIFLYIITRLYGLSDSIMFIFTPKNLFNLEMMVFSIGISFIFLSIYLPIYFSSVSKARIVGQVGTSIVILGPIVIMKFTENRTVLSIGRYWGNLNLNIILLAISIALYLLSLQLSISIYNKKEF